MFETLGFVFLLKIRFYSSMLFNKVCKMQTCYYFYRVKILVKKTILYYTKKYPLGLTQLLVCYNEFSKLELNNFNELKSIYGNASIVNNIRVVFNIKGNDFRLVVSVNFVQQACYVIWFGSHQEYNKIDVGSVAFDTTILNG